MNLAQMLSQRMQSPGAMGEFKDRTSNPQAMAQMGSAMTGNDKQEGPPMEELNAIGDPDGAPAGPSIGGNGPSGTPSDAGLGMLSSAHANAVGEKAKAPFKKALDHAHAKMGKHHKGLRTPMPQGIKQ